MKTIVTVNTELPTVNDEITYISGKSLLDYDIVLFDPKLPYQNRVEFTAGGSCITIEGTQTLKNAISHWRGELNEAIKAGKTIFFILNEYEIDQGATSSTMSNKSSRTYNTSQINNYEVLPSTISVRNTKGQNFKVADNKFKGLYDVIKDVAEYRVVFISDVKRKIFTTKDGTNVVSSVINFQSGGSIVFLPFLKISEMTKYDKQTNKVLWTDDAVIASKKLVGQLVEIDKMLNSQSEETPKPDWLESLDQPKRISVIDETIKRYEREIISLQEKNNIELESKKLLTAYSALLYETGKPLEQAIEKSLELLGYKVENFRDGDLEIDHVITGPEGVRMIGESEGKDNSAIDISKFRQLESNINEDLERESVTEAAKGLLFGNGYRFVEPSKRPDQFTEKCLKNAQRLGTNLIKTADLYDVVLHILDNPKDELFKKSCRVAIESNSGNIVIFPKPIKKVIKKIK